MAFSRTLTFQYADDDAEVAIDVEHNIGTSDSSLITKTFCSSFILSEP